MTEHQLFLQFLQANLPSRRTRVSLWRLIIRALTGHKSRNW